MIACVAWGSLVWDPGSLPIEGAWRSDGPALPVEYARQSRDRRLTLVILPLGGARVTCLWTPLSVATLDTAREALGEREGVPPANRVRDIGVWSHGVAGTARQAEIETWAQAAGVAGVVWAALRPKFGGIEDRVPTAEEAVNYFQALQGQVRDAAETYVRRTPRQVMTPYRTRFEAELGWTPL